MTQHIFQARIMRVRSIVDETTLQIVAPDRDSALETLDAAYRDIPDDKFSVREEEVKHVDVGLIWMGEPKHPVHNRAFTFGFSVVTDRDDEPGREIPASLLRARIIEAVNNLSDAELAENIGPSFNDYVVEAAEIADHNIEAVHP